MSVSFGRAAASLYGKAALLLGWRPDEFWTATPEELSMTITALLPDGDASPLDADTLARLIAREKGQQHG